MSKWTFTSESVTEGHPDKMADRISDSILDALLAKDPASRVACETLVTTGMAVIAGEITTSAYVEIPKIVRDLELLQPMYRQTSAYGHFGRSAETGFTWERTDRVDALKGALGL